MHWWRRLFRLRSAPVHIGEVQVERRDIRQIGAGGIEALLAAEECLEGESFGDESAEQREGVRVVIDGDKTD